MREAYSLVWSVLVLLFRSRVSLEAEILILRHQLNIQRRHVPKRVAFSAMDRLIFVGLYRLVPNTIKALTIVKPDTVIRWHRAGFRSYWRSPDPQAVRPPDEKVNVLQATLPTNFKVAKFDNDLYTDLLRQLEREIDAIRFDVSEGKIELPVKLRVHDSIFVPLAKWAMLLAGNYRCITKDGMRTAQEAVYSNLDESRSVYNFVNELCVK